MVGNIVPLGRVTKTVTEPFVPGGAYPSWLETDEGTASFASISQTNSHSKVSVATDASVGAAARMRLSHDIPTSKYLEIVWSVYGLRASNDSNVSLQIGLCATDGSAGVDLYQTGSSNPCFRTIATAGNTTYEHEYCLLGGSGYSRKRRNISLRFQPSEGEVYALMDDQVVAYADVSATLVQGNIRPWVRLTTLNGTSYSFDLAAVELSLVMT